jgi:hypothetical protein
MKCDSVKLVPEESASVEGSGIALLVCSTAEPAVSVATALSMKHSESVHLIECAVGTVQKIDRGRGSGQTGRGERKVQEKLPVVSLALGYAACRPLFDAPR